MGRTRSKITIIATFVVAMALVYTQFCAISCALGSCIFASAQMAAKTQPAHHCHHHDQQSSKKQNNQNDCHSNTEVIAALPDSVSSISTAVHYNQPLAAVPAIAQHLFSITRENPNIGLPFRSPPVMKIVSALRI
ncbi:MAG TPA: hypothetical protein VFC63_14870 [Blastocatellia bacterium]|nr:hypothetical protein [Blastocatellia bacterium]